MLNLLFMIFALNNVQKELLCFYVELLHFEGEPVDAQARRSPD